MMNVNVSKTCLEARFRSLEKTNRLLVVAVQLLLIVWIKADITENSPPLYELSASGRSGYQLCFCG
jgi:hypothetical protein